jgi:hypothetical protein
MLLLTGYFLENQRKHKATTYRGFEVLIAVAKKNYIFQVIGYYAL